jgi:Flp pilus assembly protein TadG
MTLLSRLVPQAKAKSRPLVNKRREIADDDSGSGLVDFALVFPVFLTFLVGVMEVAMLLFASALLEAGVREGSRFGVTGYTPEGVDRLAAIMDVIQEHTTGLIDINDATVDIKVYPSFDQVGETDADGNDIGTPGPGGPGDIVLYEINYEWETITGLLTPFLGGDEGKIPLRVAIVVRNEPFNDDE